MSIPRTYSEKFLPGQTDLDLMQNKNADWISYPFAKLSYVIIVAVVWLVLHTSQLFSVKDEVTVVNVVHGVVSCRLCCPK